MKNSKLKGALIYIIFIVLAVVVFSSVFNGFGQETKYSDVLNYFKTEQVKEVYVNDSYVLALTLQDGRMVAYQFNALSLQLFQNDLGDLMNEQHSKGIIKSIDFQPESSMPSWLPMVAIIFVIVLLVAVWMYGMKKADGGGGPGKMSNFGKARVKTPPTNDKNKVLFKDVAGADEEKEELVEIVDFLKNPSKYTKLGAKIPHGVLLVGPPGTGKTLLAKAVAGEAGVPFFSISGSDFVEMYVGVGASRVRDLFMTARKVPASIVFIDEIDAVGRHRGAGLGGGHDEREQTLNQLLVEMDGFGSHDGIIVIAATNRPDILDPALLRPGRFDRQITVNYPDLSGREAILKVHTKGKPLAEDVSLSDVAKRTVGFTGADLANLMNEAALIAARNNRSLIGKEDVEKAYFKIILGTQKKHNRRPEHATRLTAYHEAGHAVVGHFCEHSDPVTHITIIPSGRAGGVTIQTPQEDRYYYTRNQMMDDIAMCLGGRVAEALIMGDISQGASGDIQQATATARNMVMRYGMSEKLGTVLYGNEHSSSEIFLGRDLGSEKNYSDSTAALIDSEIKDIIAKEYARAESILKEHIDKLHFVAQYLIDHESMDREQFDAAMNGATAEELEAMAEKKRKDFEEANKAREERNAARERKEEEERKLRENGWDSGNDGVYYGDVNPEDIEKDKTDDDASESDNEGDDNTDN